MAKLSGLAKPDSQGRFTRDIGWKLSDGGKWVQHRFILGREEAEAEVRMLRLCQVWAAVEARWTRDGKRTERAMWDDVTLKIARAAASGEREVRFNPDELAPFCVSPALALGNPDLIRQQEIYSYLLSLQKDFPVVAVSLSSDEVVEAGKREKDKVERYAATRVLPKEGVGAVSLFAALDAFAERERNAYASEHGTRQVQRVEFLKGHIEDVPLTRFGGQQIDNVLNVLKRRPLTKRGKPASIDYTRSVIKIVRGFVEWLDGADLGWQKPRGYRIKPAKLLRTPQENAGRVRVPTYSRDELATLWKYATPLERVYLALALNCGYGAGELTTLQVEEIGKHPTEPVEGTFICRQRSKTGIYGEWFLWDISVAAVAWYRSHVNTASSGPFVLVRGKPIGFTQKGNRQTYFNNMMTRLVERIRKDQPAFRFLSFNKLKKTAATLMKRAGGATAAKMFVCHGSLAGDPLLDRYASRAFRKVFKAQRKVRRHLETVFAVESPFPDDGKRRNISLSMVIRERIVALRKERKTYKAIAQECDVCVDTVRRYLRSAGL